MDENDSDHSDENMEVSLVAAEEAAPEPAPEAEHSSSPLSDDNEEEEHFDISLAASHSYLGEELVRLGARSEVPAGAVVRLPVCPHLGAVFPGETVPMLLPTATDRALLDAAMRSDKLFALLCPDESGVFMSRFGVVCEVLESGDSGAGAVLKARAVARCRVVGGVGGAGGALRGRGAGAGVPQPVRILPDYPTRPPPPPRSQRCLRRLDAASTAWPSFIYDIFDYHRLRDNIKKYFKTLNLDHLLPSEPVCLSFWVASNLALCARDRLALFSVDDALLRLHMELAMINKKSMLCCSSCMGEVTRRENIFAMSSEGVHSNFSNPGGVMHDLVTVSVARAALSGGASAECSWFPGYRWTVALCAGCTAHLGWRFDAERRSLRPQTFFGLCRNRIQPREDEPTDPRSRMDIV